LRELQQVELQHVVVERFKTHHRVRPHLRVWEDVVEKNASLV
jgi:hypothetical protein